MFPFHNDQIDHFSKYQFTVGNSVSFPEFKSRKLVN